MNRAAFYAELRKASSGVFGKSLSKSQVAAMEEILNAGEALDNPSMAYVLATGYHEAKMTPQRENLNYKTAAQIRKTWPSRFPTDASAVPFVRKPKSLANKVYNGRLGNRETSDDGWTYRGGGLDQLTGRDNYRRLATLTGADLVADPDLILEPVMAVASLVHGMTTGRYRGHKLADYFQPGAVNFEGARQIVNPDRHGALVAGYARAFLDALQISGRTPFRPSGAVTTPKAQTPPPMRRKPADKAVFATGIIALIATIGAGIGAKWVEVQAWLSTLFGG